MAGGKTVQLLLQSTHTCLSEMCSANESIQIDKVLTLPLRVFYTMSNSWLLMIRRHIFPDNTVPETLLQRYIIAKLAVWAQDDYELPLSGLQQTQNQETTKQSR